MRNRIQTVLGSSESKNRKRGWKWFTEIFKRREAERRERAGEERGGKRRKEMGKRKKKMERKSGRGKGREEEKGDGGKEKEDGKGGRGGGGGEELRQKSRGTLCHSHISFSVYITSV